MITAAVALVPRLDCRYRSLSQQLEIVSFPDFSSRYRTALSAIVALTSTPTRTKPPQAADLVPPSSTTTYELLRIPPQVAGSVSGHHKPTRRAKTMVPHLHSVLRVPDLHAGAGAGQRHHAPGQTFHQAHILVPIQPACQNTPSCALGRAPKQRCRHPEGGKQHVSRCLGRRRTSYLRAFPFCVRSMQPARKHEGCRVSASLPRIPRQTESRHQQLHCGLFCAAGYDLHAAAFSLSPQWAGPCTDIRAVVF